MKYFLTLLVLFLLINCKVQPRQVNFNPPSDWKIISDCSVRFYVKPDIKLDKDARGVDSCYQEYRSANISITLDVTSGIGNSTSFKDILSRKQDFQLENIIVDGRQAELITYYDETLASAIPDKYANLCYVALLRAPQFFKARNLGLFTISRTQIDRNEALNILQSVQFDNR